MADILGRYLQGEAAEENRLDKEEQLRSHRLNQTKLMMDMIRANAPLRPEDARDLARVHELEPHETERLYSSIYANTPAMFPQVHQTISAAHQAKFQNEERMSLRELINDQRMNLEANRRDMQTPSQEEYETYYAPLFAQHGPVPPYSRLTHTELARNLQLMTGQKNAATAETNAGNRNTPRPSRLDEPMNPEVAEEVADAMGRPLPKGYENWTRDEFNTWKTAKQPKADPALTPQQEITSEDDVMIGLLDRLQIPYNDDTPVSMIATARQIAKRAISEGGNISDNADRIADEVGFSRRTKKKRASAVADSLSTSKAPKPQKSAAQKKADMQAVIDRSRY